MELQRRESNVSTDPRIAANGRQTHGKIASDAMAFSTREIAEEFAKKWTGHPWWCKPSGQFEVIEVTPRYRQVIDGYDPI